MKNYIRLSALMCAIASSFALAAGAIAVDDQEGSMDTGYGLVTGASSRESAGAEAMKLCKIFPQPVYPSEMVGAQLGDGIEQDHRWSVEETRPLESARGISINCNTSR